jgi:transposase-like protein
MSILTPSVCFLCCKKIHKHGKRSRHVIDQGKKIWDSVQRFFCPACSKTSTLLKSNMLPHKHYAAQEIEQVLQKHEKPTCPPHECGAEESTLRRWLQEFPPKLYALAACLYSLANISSIELLPPLQSVYDALALLPRPPSGGCRLAWAYIVSKTHPVHV